MRIRDFLSIRNLVFLCVFCAVLAGPASAWAATLLTENFDANC